MWTLAGLLAVALLGAGCQTAPPSPSTAPASVPGPTAAAPPSPTAAGVTPAHPTPPSASDQAAALAALCNPQNDASFANLIAALDGLGETNVSQGLADALARAAAGLELLTLGPDGILLRDAALEQMGDLATGIDDPTARSATASAAAGTLRGLEIQVCPLQEI